MMYHVTRFEPLRIQARTCDDNELLAFAAR